MISTIERIHIIFISYMYSSAEKIYLSSPQLQNLIKKKPFTQMVNGVEFTYSILSKIQKRFIMTNDRFLILKGVQSIGYARSLSEKTTLPFKHQGDMPKTKSVYALSAVQAVTTQNEVLKIQFTFDSKAHWEFVCPSKPCALQWRKIIYSAIQKMRNLNPKYQKYSQYPKQTSPKKVESSPQKETIINRQQPISPERDVKNKSFDKTTNQLSRNESLDSLNMTNSASQQKTLTKSRSELGVNTGEIVLVKVPDNSQRQIIESQANNMNFSKKNKQFGFNQQGNTGIVGPHTHNYSFQGQKGKELSPSKGPSLSDSSVYTSSLNNAIFPAPITHFIAQNASNTNQPHQKLEMPSQLSKIEEVFLEKSLFQSPSQTFLNKSFSTISMNGRQQVRSEIMACRRDWIDDIISRQQEGQLIIDFKKYAKKIVQVLVNQLHIPNEKRIFQQRQCNNEYASYIVDDVYVEIYFFTQEQIDEKHKRYQRAVKQFKNFDYFLQVTQNEQNVFVPLMAIFEFKGFVGMVKTIVCNESEPYQNKKLFNELNPHVFQQQSRISSQILLNEVKCKVINYRKSNFLGKLVTSYENIYFIDKLDSFLPEQRSGDLSKSNRLIRPQLIQDDLLQEYVFGQKQKDINGFQILSILDKKILSFVKHIQDHEQYFTNSQQLTQLIHSFGLNMRHLGSIYKKITQKWLKIQFKAELAARSLKTLFRFDMQNCILNHIERMKTIQKQSERETKRVISFLNVALGNGESTLRLWRGLNNYSSKHYGSVIWEETFNDINIGYFLQAIQHHLKIVLDERIHKKVCFQSNRTFQQSDFVRFEPDINIYNLDFTETFEEINECLEEVSKESFQDLCRIMVKQTKSKKTYIQLLRGLPIYQKINEYLLNFISPQDNLDFYYRLETAHVPKRFVYESKLAEIRWHLKFNRLEGLERIIKFIEQDGRKWLGPIHPLFVQLNRILAQYYCDKKAYYMKAVSLATGSLQMQAYLFGSDVEPLWKDHYLLGKIYFTHQHYQNALPCLIKAKKLINFHNESQLQHFSQLLICLSKCYQQNKMIKQAYLNIRQLYNVLRQDGSIFILDYLLESALMIKELLENSQEYDSYYRFIETDFSQAMILFIGQTQMLKKVMRHIFFPYIKSVIFQKSKSRSKALSLLQQISKLAQSSFACTSYLQQKTRQRKFPHGFMQSIKDLDNIVDEIQTNQLIHKWVSFHRMSNETLLQRIGGNQINRGFQFLADLSAVMGILGPQAIRYLSTMQK